MSFKELLDSKNMTRYELAKKAEIGQCTVHEIASGKRKSIRLETAAKIAQVLNVNIETINKCIGEEDNNDSQNRNNSGQEKNYF